jgi:hypothetical protein
MELERRVHLEQLDNRCVRGRRHTPDTSIFTSNVSPAFTGRLEVSGFRHRGPLCPSLAVRNSSIPVAILLHSPLSTSRKGCPGRKEYRRCCPFPPENTVPISTYARIPHPTQYLPHWGGGRG